MRRAASIAVAAALACGAVFAASAAGTPAALKRVSPPGGAYSVELPRTWRFADASYPSDHLTHLWFDPANALRKLLVVVSGCAGCAQANGRPNPAAGVPAGATAVVRLSSSALAFRFFSDDDPWMANGLSLVTRQHGTIDGYASVELWLPAAQHTLATTMLNSFRLPG